MTSLEILPSAEIAEAVPCWRLESDTIRCSFRATSYPGAAVLIQAFASAAEDADHHPDLDLRYPGVVHVSLNTHASGGVTRRDIDLARTYDRLAEALRCERLS